MRVYLGSDHAGFELKGLLGAALIDQGHEVIDVGALHYDAQDDYPVYCLVTAARVAAEPGTLGIVVGGSGNGEQIAANKIPGVRAALIWSEETARLAREHNDANVAGIGARMHSADEAVAIVTAFVETAFSGAARHARRIGQLAAYERSGELPDLPGSAEVPGPDGGT
ncbi:MAG: ribose-5-phosphate isomerase [Pseudonocardiales bacterium]|nr:MAG: ribose-5-phosphate isomerase [Pseudonocardiales bacterium]